MNKKYVFLSTIFLLIGVPVIFDIWAVIVGISSEIAAIAAIIPGVVLLLLVIYLTFRAGSRMNLPESSFIRGLPLFLAVSYTTILWFLYIFVGNGARESIWLSVYMYGHFPYIMLFIGLIMDNAINFMYIIPIGMYFFFSLIFWLGIIKNKKKISNGKKEKKKFFIMFAIMLCMVAVSAGEMRMRSIKVLGADARAERVYDEVPLEEYAPFYENNKLYTFTKEPSLSIGENYPKLDGATAAYPIYAAAVQGIYKNLDRDTVADYVKCSKTSEAYRRLINGETDAIFVAEPSKKQLKMAEEKGVKLRLIPIGKEAFVFFVNKSNKVDGLTVTQIQDIYTKKITNWKKLGGKNEKIIPFQRPENSGSQTVMENKIMGDIKPVEPLREEYSEFMGGIINQVADYRNYSNAIGYSFRYYATGMKKNENIKLLSIDGIEPDKQNIRSGSYPFTVSVYIITREDVKNPELEKLIEWFLGAEGQELIENVGYVSL